MIAPQNKFDAIPDELKQLPRFVCWKFENRDGGKPTKLPCNRYSATVIAHDPANHLTFGEACEAAAVNAKLAGIGFTFTGDGLLGIDFDACLDEAGKPEPWAAGLLLQLIAVPLLCWVSVPGP